MCGIAGFISLTKTDRSIIKEMTTALLHRGPDAHAVFADSTDTIFLGHTRLSIIDLSTAANQPFHSRDGRYVIVFNGEIYNFQKIRNELIANHGIQFKTTSDTEVIIEAFALWKTDVSNKLEGMFAIVIYDQLEQKLFLIRDRIGKKPLFYYQNETTFIFASEIKALLKHPLVSKDKKINKSVIGLFLHLGYIPEHYTIYTNIHKFPSGCFAEIDRNLKLNIKSYWSIRDRGLLYSTRSPESEVKKKLSQLLDGAVQSRLVSDVPLGVFLSGGTDSSLITAIASKHVTAPLKTFSIGFKESKFDESHYSRAVAKHLGTSHTEYILSEKESIDILNTYLQHFDEPFADTSAIPTMLVSRLARKEVKVVLTGDGGDELFQGYGAYDWANRLETVWWKIIRGPLRLVLEDTGKSRFQRINQLLKKPTLGSYRSHIFSQEQYFFSQEEIHVNLSREDSNFKIFEYDESFLQNRNFSEAKKQALFDFQLYLKDDLLVKVDRASMSCALECRSPLLDHSIVEYAFSLEDSFKKRHGVKKWILKELLSEHIPKAMVNRPKWGFSIPLANWMKGELRYLIDDFLNDKVIEEVGILNPVYIQKLKKEFFSGKDYLYNRLWVIIVLHKWWKENVF